jgi:hypothetical protein
MASRLPVSARGTLSRSNLRHLIGKETVKRIERHARMMGIRGRTRGHFFRINRTTTVLEVTVDRVPVAELFDYGSDGFMDRVYLIGPSGPHRYGPSSRLFPSYWGDDWDDDWDDRW